jgi:hypothetical protein
VRSANSGSQDPNRDNHEGGQRERAPCAVRVGHALHADSQRNRHRHRQAFGHHRDHLADGHHQHLCQRQLAPQAQQHHQHKQAERRRRQGAAELLQAQLQRRLRLLGAFGQAGDAAHLGMDAGGHDDGTRTVGGDMGAGIHHAVTVGQAGGIGHRCDRLGHRHRLAGECGLGHLQLGFFDQGRLEQFVRSALLRIKREMAQHLHHRQCMPYGVDVIGVAACHSAVLQ